MDYPSSRVIVSKTNGDGKKQPVVTFLGIAYDNDFEEEDCNQKRIRVIPDKKQHQTTDLIGISFSCVWEPTDPFDYRRRRSQLHSRRARYHFEEESVFCEYPDDWLRR